MIEDKELKAEVKEKVRYLIDEYVEYKTSIPKPTPVVLDPESAAEELLELNLTCKICKKVKQATKQRIEKLVIKFGTIEKVKSEYVCRKCKKKGGE